MPLRIFRAGCALALAATLAAYTAAITVDRKATLDRITAQSLQGHVWFLASDLLEGRGTPSRGLDVAAEYIAAQFRRAGLEPIGDDGYFQTATFANVTPNMDGLELTLEAGGNTVKASAGSITLQDAAAADLSDAPVIRVSTGDQESIAKLTQDQ